MLRAGWTLSVIKATKKKEREKKKEKSKWKMWKKSCEQQKSDEKQIF